ncbi:MAG: histidine--tRNA ligase [Candidatus Egerieousia sp.]|nr:histidine--tRNA ligase [bacterium]MDY5255534.1 histidine--tRNA ligase [Candidatus Egerieousia sp.]
MAVQKPSIPKGTRDFSPAEMACRNYIFDTVKSIFKKYGYAPLETPAMENLTTLLGKYGDEGDKLLFKILNSGEAFAGVDAEELSHSNALSLKVCEKGLRYDLTVPFARYVVQHQNEITFPFKRFQIQPVWRADRPQKGRYREFYQCDVDVIGSQSQINELELVQIADEVFRKLDINVCIKINNRKVLQGLAEIIGHPDKLVDITVAIDKIDKIGLQAVKEELAERGIDSDGIAILEPILQMQGTNREKLAAIRTVLAGSSATSGCSTASGGGSVTNGSSCTSHNSAPGSTASEVGLKGVDELEELFNYIESANIKQKVEIDLSLARGLNYYTGAIFEVKALDFQIGSICGGGRYDNLTGIFGLPNISGVGISFGADRIYDVLKGLDKFPKDAIEGTKLLFSNMGSAETAYALPIAAHLRSQGISCEIFPDNTKLKKQFDYATKKGIRYFAIIGEDEIKAGEVTLKDLTTGTQQRVPKEELSSLL